jgi:hypothetical protein
LVTGIGLACDLGIRLGRSKAVSPSRPFADGVWNFGVGRFAQAALRALDASLEGTFFGVVEFFLVRLSLAEEFQRPLVLLVIEIIQTIAQQVPSPSDRGYPVESRLRGVGRRGRIGGCRSRTIGLAQLLSRNH